VPTAFIFTFSESRFLNDWRDEYPLEIKRLLRWDGFARKSLEAIDRFDF
jgi:hypothetical protein